MKFYFPFLLLLVVFSSCRKPSKYKDYTEVNPNLYYKIISLGDDERSLNEVVYIDVEYQLFNKKMDSLDARIVHFYPLSSKKINFITTLKNKLHANDSVNCKLTKKIVENFFLSDKIGNDKLYNLHFKILKSYNKVEYEEVQVHLAWLKDREMNERVDLLNYLAKNGIDANNYYDGMYYVELKKGRGKYLEKGNAVFIHHKGYFLDGTVFDIANHKKNRLEFTIGDPEQVLKGYEIGVSLMKRGGKAKFIIPSQLAYGERGSSTGVVPPFTSLVYEVEIVHVE